MPQPPKILFLYDYYYPAQKSGGITRSLYNLAVLLKEHYHVHILCSNTDLDGKRLKVTTDRWVERKEASVYYASQLHTHGFHAIMEALQPTVVYLNGLFSRRFHLIPLAAKKRYDYNVPFICCPRGMLQQGALQVKPLKKRLYLMAMKSRWRKRLQWHATDAQEAADIRFHLGEKPRVVLAIDVPDASLPEVQPVRKEKGKVSLCYVSLITAKKNLHLALQLLTRGAYRGKIDFDIFGPVKDPGYWKACKQLINNAPENVHIRYQGEVAPTEVHAILAKYHALFLPSRGENFGHAIFESLACGRPALISDQTPWRDLEGRSAGWDLPLDQPLAFQQALERLLDMDQELFDQYSHGARRVAESFFEAQDLVAQYKKLFG